MSDRNKIITILFYFLLSSFLASCTMLGNGYVPKKTSAQIDCPTSSNIVIVERTNREEVYQAAQKAWAKKKAEGTNEGYTVLRLPDGRSTAIFDVKPEDFGKCSVITLPPSSRF